MLITNGLIYWTKSLLSRLYEYYVKGISHGMRLEFSREVSQLGAAPDAQVTNIPAKEGHEG